MKRKKPEDVDATRVSPDGSPPGPSETQLFSQAVQEAEENEMNRTTVGGERAGDPTGSTRIGAGADATNLLSGDSTRILDRDRPGPARMRRTGITAQGAFFWLAAGATAGAVALVAISLYTTP